MNEEQSRLMLRLQQLGLTMDDLREYMDTHLSDGFAIERFNSTADEYRKLLEQISESYGPLTWSCENYDADNWLWAGQDFPWAY